MCIYNHINERPCVCTLYRVKLVHVHTESNYMPDCPANDAKEANPKDSNLTAFDIVALDFASCQSKIRHFCIIALLFPLIG